MLCMIFLERLLIKGELNNFIYSEVVLDNKICYKVDLNIYDTKNSEQFDSSLTFLVDTNQERQFGSDERWETHKSYRGPYPRSFQPQEHWDYQDYDLCWNLR